MTIRGTVVLVATLLAVAGCGEDDQGESSNAGTSQDTTTTTAPLVDPTPAGGPPPGRPAKKPRGGGSSDEAALSAACDDLPSSALRTTCEVGFADCSLDAAARVRAYTAGNGPTLDQIAYTYAKREFGNDFDWQAAMAGCLAALQVEYDRQSS